MSSSSVLDSPSTSTYEATKARERIQLQPDKIVWDSDYAYRQSPYRLLHHQKGIVGHVEVRLLEASNLQRSYWSALALPGVKHLGLSKAHGAISSYAQISLHNVGNTTGGRAEVMTSPVMVHNNHPVWNHCVGRLPLRKGRYQDGERIQLQVQMVEEASGVEHKMSALPLLPSQDDRILGTGLLDVTPVLLGMTSGGVIDVWVDITKLPKDEQHESLHGELDSAKADLFSQDLKKPSATKHYELSDDDDDSSMSQLGKNVTGQVRLLVSYRPNGLKPQPHDLVALEAFARRHHRTSSCVSILPPLSPMKVLQTHDDAFVLVEYRMSGGAGRATMRIPRSAVFVVERTNLVDGAIHLALLPTDFFFSTPLGYKTKQVAGPVVGAATEVAMPALLSAKLVWTAVRTTTGAGLTGVQAATNAILQQSREAHEHRHQQQSFHASSSTASLSEDEPQKYVSL